MGRRIKSNKMEIRQIGLSYVPDKDYPIDKTYIIPENHGDVDYIKGEALIQGINEIANRERIPRSEITIRALAVYWLCHYGGNYQTLMASFSEGGIKSEGQIEQEIINEVKKQYSKEVKFAVLLQKCREYGFKKDLVEIGDRIAQRLIKEGWRVWR